MASSKVDMKIVLLGAEAAGKTCLVHRYLHERFNAKATYQAVGISFLSCSILFSIAWLYLPIDDRVPSLMALVVSISIR